VNYCLDYLQARIERTERTMPGVAGLVNVVLWSKRKGNSPGLALPRSRLLYA